MPRVKPKPSTICEMEGCENEAKVHGLCFACYSYLNYWKKKTPGDIMRRIRKVRLFQNRLGTLASRGYIRRVK